MLSDLGKAQFPGCACYWSPGRPRSGPIRGANQEAALPSWAPGKELKDQKFPGAGFDGNSANFTFSQVPRAGMNGKANSTVVAVATPGPAQGPGRLRLVVCLGA